MKKETKTVYIVDYNDLDDAVNNFLKEKGAAKSNYECVAHEEWGNDESHSFNVGEYEWAAPSEEDKAEILGGKLHYRLSTILEWMHQEGKIEAGNYVVKVCW